MLHAQSPRLLRAVFFLAFVFALSLLPSWSGAALAEKQKVTPLLTNTSYGFWFDKDTLILRGERNGEFGTYQITFGKTIHYKRLFSSRWAAPLMKIGKDQVLFRDKSAWELGAPNFMKTPYYAYNVRTGLTSLAFLGNNADPLFYNPYTNTLYLGHAFQKSDSFSVTCEIFNAVTSKYLMRMATDGIHLYAVTEETISRIEGSSVIEQKRIIKNGEFIENRNTISAKGRIFIAGSYQDKIEVLYVYAHNKGYTEIFNASRFRWAYAEEEDKLYVSLGGKSIFKEDGAGGMAHVINLEDSYWLHSPSPQGDKLLVMSSVETVKGETRVTANILYLGRP